MKNLKPSHREKKRYLLLEGKDASKEKIEKTILEYIGVLGFAKASPMFVKSNILAVNRKEIDKIRASFLISKKDIKIKRISGTLKGMG